MQLASSEAAAGRPRLSQARVKRRANPKAACRTESSNPFTPTAQTNLLTFTSRLRVRWPENVIEYVIAYPTTLGDAFRLIEGPMNAEINPALAILFVRL